ncbi:acyl-CoA dehydrogenase family protein [candidate division CSSED10-310 bacterium]|uniref:Acyl-CoA dehydrogenase family protein n=1 Tax=candidate division CSSED10-310 bacterium TaxID=2855610 RepID=A0ABV6Z004_UNCC1
MDYLNFDLFNPTDEHRALRDTVRKFSVEEIGPQANEFDDAEKFNMDLYKKLSSELGLFGLTIPEEDGGIGMDAIATVIVHEEMSRFDPAFTMSYLAHEVLFNNNFYHGSSPALREKYLARVLGGGWIGGMAMTEPDAGTDVLGMKCTVERRGDLYILNGTKQFITNGPEADLFIIYAKPDRDKRDITTLIVEKSFPGFSVGQKEIKMGMKASSTSCLVFEDCEVPVENLMGEEGKGMVHMMRNLEIERVSLGAQSIGLALQCVDVMSHYAINERSAFGKKLISFGQMQRMVAESYAKTAAARALIYLTAKDIAPDVRNSLGASSAKLIATTTGEEVARNAVQVLAGYGYSREYNVERLLRDAILLSIGGGTNEAMQKNITADLKRVYQ